VGAIDKDGKATSYSCYPGLRGIATWGGEVPKISPQYPPSAHPTITTKPLDAVRGIYSSVEYPPLSSVEPAQYYDAPDDSAWAYWIGTSFATPIIAALAARVLELKPTTSVHQYILGSATTPMVWSNMDPALPNVVTQPGATNGTADGRAYKVTQTCVARDDDDEDEVQVEIEVTEIDVITSE
jgi:Subtilase family